MVSRDPKGSARLCLAANVQHGRRILEDRTMARKKISIGSWAYSIGPYQNNPVPFEQVVKQLKELGFDGVELGGFPPHPNPDDCPDLASRVKVKKLVEDAGLEFSGLAANLWMHKIISVDDNRPFLNEFEKNLRFAR